MHTVPITNNRPTPLPTDQIWLKKFNAAVGSMDKDDQALLANEMKLNYHGGIGKLIWVMTTCRPDLAYASVKLLQSNSYPHKHHYHGLCHALQYLYKTRYDGLHFWWTSSCPDLPERPIPTIISNCQDLLFDFDRLKFDARTTHIYSDSNWATCVKTCRLFIRLCVHLAGGTIAYKTKFQLTVALSSTEAKFMAACDAEKMSLYIRSVLWDLNVPQEAATITYEDNDACTAMANAQKPSPRTVHMDIKYFALCNWVEQVLLILDWIDTKINLADPFTKALECIAFHRHVNFILGHVPP
jgi:hypothetical protein